MTKERAIVVAPGRGVYGQSELGYLGKWHQDKSDFISQIDQYRAERGHQTISSLDSQEKYRASLHASSQNASSLIYTCALADFADIDRDQYEIVAVTGNSLGWYLTLAASGALAPEQAIHLIDTMGHLMESHGVGGQLVYPIVDEKWRPSQDRADIVNHALAETNKDGSSEAFVSIELGGIAVLAGTEKGLLSLEKQLPTADDRYPFRLARHAAFHTPLLNHVSEMAFDALGQDMFERPGIPMIDGRGEVWRSYHDLHQLRQYTLGYQITQTYSFSNAIEVAIKEFAPDKLILLGPGSTLGAPVAQELIKHKWLGLDDKSAFIDRQKNDPFVLSMGRDDQRELVLGR